MPRAFLAIKLPRQVSGTLARCRAAFIDRDPAWAGEKWVAEENLHVTLRFLGPIPEIACDLIAEEAAPVLARIAPYRLQLAAARAVPRARSASMLWVGAGTGADETAQLAAELERAVSFLNLKPEGHDFHTHVTLARARRPLRASHEALDEVDRILHQAAGREVTMSVREVTLYESTLTPRGPLYTELAVLPLGG